MFEEVAWTTLILASGPYAVYAVLQSSKFETKSTGTKQRTALLLT